MVRFYRECDYVIDTGEYNHKILHLFVRKDSAKEISIQIDSTYTHVFQPIVFSRKTTDKQLSHNANHVQSFQ